MVDFKKALKNKIEKKYYNPKTVFQNFILHPNEKSYFLNFHLLESENITFLREKDYITIKTFDTLEYITNEPGFYKIDSIVSEINNAYNEFLNLKDKIKPSKNIVLNIDIAEVEDPPHMNQINTNDIFLVKIKEPLDRYNKFGFDAEVYTLNQNFYILKKEEVLKLKKVFKNLKRV